MNLQTNTTIQPKKKKKVHSKLEWGLTSHFHFPSNFLSKLGRLIFGGIGEKTPKPHQNHLPFCLSTKHPKLPFAPLFSSPPFSSSLTKWTLKRETL